MPKYYETDEFNKLNAEWKVKLKKSGFEDHEETVVSSTNESGRHTPIDQLKTWTFSLFRGRYNATQYEAQADYFRFAGQFLHEHAFKNQTQQIIWGHYCNGVSHRKIDELIGRTVGTARRTIIGLSKIMMEKLKNKADND